MLVQAIDFESATFKDVDVDEQGEPIGMFGFPRKVMNQRLLEPLLESHSTFEAIQI